MQADDPNITPVRTASAAAAFSIFVLLALIGSAFLLAEITVAKITAGANAIPVF
jgi:hypothetical protein